MKQQNIPPKGVTNSISLRVCKPMIHTLLLKKPRNLERQGYAAPNHAANEPQKMPD